MAVFSVDFSQYKAFIERLKQAGSGDFKNELALFLEGAGYELLRIVQDEIIRLKVMDTRLLLQSFYKGREENVWTLDEGNLTLEIGTNVKYATYVNDGHWLNPKGVDSRFVPGRWEGHRFIYDPDAKTGMVLKQKWVEGAHYWENALRSFEKIFPELLDTMVQRWIDKYFSDFL